MAGDIDIKTLGDLLPRPRADQLIDQMKNPPWWESNNYLPCEVRCQECGKTWRWRESHCLACTGTGREPIPFTEVWGV